MVAVCRSVPRTRRRFARGRAEQAIGPRRRQQRANLDNPVQLVPLGNGTFRYVASAGGGPVGEIVRFVEENGRVIRMITGDSYVERVQP